MNLSETVRELFTENPMTLEATRTVRRMLRAGNDSVNPYASRNLNRFLLGTLAVLYGWLFVGILKSGEDVSAFLIGGELLLLTLIVPGSLFGAIAVEREKQTFESLIMTRLTPAQIVCGKLVWRVGLIAALMVLFVPLLALSHLMPHHLDSRMTGRELAWSQVIIFAWSVLVGTFSLWVSAKSKKGITALLGVVASLVAFLVLLPMLSGLFGMSNFRVDPQNPLQPAYLHCPPNASCGPPHGEEPSAEYTRLAASNLIASVVMCHHPAWLLLAPHSVGSSDSYEHSVGLLEFWKDSGIVYWGVAVYAALSGVFVRASIKTLRGLEMPVADKPRRAFNRRGGKGA